jgi:hypothetical protein
MAKKKGAISVSDLERAAKEGYGVPEEETIEWAGLSVDIKTTLSIQEVVAFVEGVVDECYTSDMKTFMPEVKDFLKGCYILSLYAKCKLPSDVHKKYNLVVRLRGLIDTILEHVNAEQYAGIELAIEERLRNNNASVAAAALSQVNAVTASIENLEGQLASMFSGVKPEQMASFINVFASGAIDEEKLASAVVNARYQEGDEDGASDESSNHELGKG